VTLPSPVVSASPAAVTAAGYVGLFSSTTIAAALPAGVAIGMTGAIVLSVPVATVQRVTGNEVLGRITAAFTTGGAAATLTGAVAGPLVAQAIQLTGAAVAAASVTLAAAALALVIVPRTMLPHNRQPDANRPPRSNSRQPPTGLPGTAESPASRKIAK
jgi:predicted MFS family arabinose efflux permease